MGLRILFPLDGSERSFGALERALPLFQGTPGLEVTLFNVRQPGFENAPEHVIEQFDEDEDDEVFPTTASSERMLEQAASICSKYAIEAERCIVEGDYYKEILATADEYDLVVMHALDKRGMGEKLRGSMTEKLARNLPTNVMFVRDDAE